MVEKTQLKTRKILEALDSHGEKGCGVISLSLETGFSQQAFRGFFRKHKEYCVPIAGESKYKLNRLTVENGSVEQIIDSIEQRQAEEKVSARVSNAFFWGLMLGLIVPHLGGWLFELYKWLF